jgi:malate dehydrogenase (oxaloacetate-decarboxylating)(NADP+)
VPVEAITKNPEDAYRYTSKGNLIAVITDGSAILGLGNRGALAAKPVMEGKAVLFKKFADIDVFDIEVATQDADRFIETVVNIAPTFGGINLEDIAAPNCFKIEHELVERLDIPVFHDDQHGTAIVLAAGLLNALELQEKHIGEIKVVCVGAGAAGIACMNLLVALGAQKANILLLDRKGVIHDGRDDLTGPGGARKRQFASRSKARTLADALRGADVFIGLSGPGLVSQDMLKGMAPRPIVLPTRKSCPSTSWRFVRMPSSAPAAATIRTRSTTCSVSPTSSAAHSTCARAASTRPCTWPRSMRCVRWHARRYPLRYSRLMISIRWLSGRTTSFPSRWIRA